jgi:hypothetical protein
MVVELRYVCDSIRSETDKIQDTYVEIEESFDLVNQLVFLRKKKLAEYTASVNKSRSNLGGLNSPFNNVVNKANNNKILSEMIDSLQNLLKELKIKKKEVKCHRYDPKNQYFLSLRLKQSTKIVEEIKLIEGKGDSLITFVRFCKDNLVKLEEKSLLLSRKSEQMTLQAIGLIKGENFSSQELRRLKQLYMEMNSVVSDSTIVREEFLDKVNLLGFSNFNPHVDMLLSSFWANTAKLSKTQEQMIPFMKHDLSKYDQVKLDTRTVLEESEKFLLYLKDNEDKIYNFDQTGKLANNTNKIQSSLFRTSGVLLTLREKIRMERISKDITALHEKVEMENKNFHALKTIFDNNSYFASENIENITFEEDKEDFEILDQILEMVGDVISDYKKNIFSVDNLSPIVVSVAKKINELAIFLLDVLERWKAFDRGFRKSMQNKDQVSRYRETLEGLYHPMQASIGKFDSEKNFKSFFVVFQER